MASYAVGKVVEYRLRDGQYHDAVVLVDNTGDNVDLLVKHDNGGQWQTKAGVLLGTTYETFRTK